MFAQSGDGVRAWLSDSWRPSEGHFDLEGVCAKRGTSVRAGSLTDGATPMARRSPENVPLSEGSCEPRHRPMVLRMARFSSSVFAAERRGGLCSSSVSDLGSRGPERRPRSPECDVELRACSPRSAGEGLFKQCLRPRLARPRTATTPPRMRGRTSRVLTSQRRGGFCSSSVSDLVSRGPERRPHPECDVDLRECSPLCAGQGLPEQRLRRCLARPLNGCQAAPNATTIFENVPAVRRRRVLSRQRLRRCLARPLNGAMAPSERHVELQKCSPHGANTGLVSSSVSRGAGPRRWRRLGQSRI